MKKNLFTLLIILVGYVFTTNIYSQIQSNGTGGGDWNTGTTWQGGTIPGAADNVVILATDTVTLAAAGSCANLTLNAGATLSLNASGLVIPGTSWSFDPTSTVIYNGTTTVQTDMAYGNLVYSTGSSGGVSTTNPANLTINGDFSITSATFRGTAATSGAVTHTVAGNVIVGPGTSARISAVNQSSATTASCTWNIGGNLSLTGDNSGNRLILFESAGPHSGTGQYIVGGDLTIGTTSGSASQVQYRSSSGTIAYGTGIIDLKGNLVKHGKIGVQKDGSAGTFTLNLVGTSTQSWSGSGSLDISNPTGSIVLDVVVNNPAGVTIDVSQTVSANVIFTLTNGNLTTDATNLLTVGAGSLIGGSSSSFVNGPLAQSVDAIGPTTKSFPVGKDLAYRPVDLTITHDSAIATTYTVEMFNGAPPVNTLPSSINKVSDVRYYTITKGTGATVTAAAVKLSYDADDLVTDFAKLRIAKDDGAGNWVDLGGSGTANTTGTIESTTNFTSFSNFVLANGLTGNNFIPVELTSFTASVSGSYVLLNWSTATETNNYGFEIQRSFRANENRIWEKVGFVNGVGSTITPQNYSFKDKFTALNGSYSYRLKQIDFDGSFTYSNEINVVTEMPRVFSLSQNYPNPFNPVTNIDYTLPADSKVKIEIFSLIGEKIAELVNEEQTAGYYTYQVSVQDLNLTSGIYVYKLTAVSESNKLFSQSRKMILLK